MNVSLHPGHGRHPKIAGLSDAAYRLWIDVLSYSCEHLTDGRIDKRTALPALGLRCKPRLLGELAAIPAGYSAGLLEDRGDHFLIHDFLRWHDTKEDVQAGRARLRERKRESRARAAGHRGTPSVTDGVTDGVTAAPASGLRPPASDQVPPNPPHAGGLNGTPRATRAERKRSDEIRRAVGPACDDDGWFEECQRLHGGSCNGAGGHRLKMRIEAEKAAATA